MYFINIYSSCCLEEKRLLWKCLLDWKQKLPEGEWIIGGEFNSVKNKKERSGKSESSSSEMEDFAKFIDLMEVVDSPLIKNKFTWISANGKIRSRLDRILLSAGVIDLWNVVAQECGKRDTSDHRPVWLKTSKLDWGPKPVKEQWDNSEVQGSRAFVLKEKLRRIRDKLRWWNKNIFGWVELKIEEEVDEIDRIEDDDCYVNNQLNQELLERRNEVHKSLWNSLHLKESILKQKARQRWVAEGDRNTKFFHSMLKARTRKN
ncbi:uncharacterized protein LOC131613239 [Vicia villosa]|uniref:uncharacterized protein LOC131613239 n=1 Tax=Vicia villosa TaxID=3911 RepID=UPI00273CE8F4|nr:uncharacterized protein LOC131613239 [Vicia villosa]